MDFEKLYKTRAEKDIPWNSERPLSIVKKLVKEGKIKGNVLDLGCGFGRHTFFLKEKGFKCCGVDISKTAVKTAKKRYPKCDFKAGSALKIPFKKNFFDTIIDIGCYHSIPPNKRKLYLEEVYRVLKDKGKVFLRCYSERNEGLIVAAHYSSKNDLVKLFSQKFDILKIDEDKFMNKLGDFRHLYFLELEKNRNRKKIIDLNLRKLIKNIPKNLEKAAHISDSDLNQLKKLKGFSRIYFGDEFCEELIPAEKELKEILDFCSKNKLGFTLVTPFLTDRGIGKIKKLVEFLPENTEVVVNDFGLFNFLRKKKLKISLGRLLVKQKRDPRTIWLKNLIPGKGYKYFKSSNVNSAVIQEFLLENNINRVEIDNLLQGVKLKLDKNISASLYFPFVYVSATRMCLLNKCEWLNERKNIRIRECGRECKKYSFVLDNPTWPKPLILKGNTQYFINDNIKKIPKNVDRIVVDAKNLYI